MMLVNFKVFFEEELTSLLATRLLRTAEEAINERIVGVSKDDRVSPRLIVDPIFDSHYVSFV